MAGAGGPFLQTRCRWARAAWRRCARSSPAQALVRGAVVVRYSAMDGELVACTMQITLRQVVDNLESTFTQKTVGGVVVSERLVERVERFNPTLNHITATGYGAARKKNAEVSTEIIGSVQ